MNALQKEMQKEYQRSIINYNNIMQQALENMQLLKETL